MRPKEIGTQPDSMFRKQTLGSTIFERAKFELDAVEQFAVISDRMMALKLIRRASFSPKDRSLVLFICGGILTPERTETVLRTMFPKLREMEERTGQAVPSALMAGRQSFP